MVKVKHNKSLVAGVMGIAVFAAAISGGKVGATGDYTTNQWSEGQHTSSWNTHNQQYQTQPAATHQYHAPQQHTYHPPVQHKTTQHVKHTVKKHVPKKYVRKAHYTAKRHYAPKKHTSYNNYYVLNAELQAHATLGVRALIADHHNAHDMYTWKQKVDANSVAIAHLMNQKYPGIKTPFLSLWRQHIVYYHEYLKAKEHGNEQAKAYWKGKLDTFTWQMSALLSKHDPHLNKYTVRHHLKVHGDQVLAIIDNIAWGNDYQVKVLSQQAVAHMSTMAALLSHKSHM